MRESLKILYQEAWNEHYDRIKKFCACHLHRCPDMIEDCCQEVFLLYYEALLKKHKIENAGAWLRKVALTQVLRIEKQAEKRQKIVDLFENSENEQYGIEYDYVEEIIKDEYSDSTIIKMLVKTLSEEEKFIFNGCFLHSYPPDEMAEQLHINNYYLYKKKWMLKKKIEAKVPEIIGDIVENEFNNTKIEKGKKSFVRNA